MQFMALIYSNESTPNTATEEQQAANFQKWMDYTQMLKDEGVFVAGDALLPTNTAVSVRMNGGTNVVTDGPFAETKEQLGGYYLYECADFDTAVKYAQKIPMSGEGTIEVRPIMVFDQ